MSAAVTLVQASFGNDGAGERDCTESHGNLRRATALLRLAAEVTLHSQFDLEQVQIGAPGARRGRSCCEAHTAPLPNRPRQ
jgi:hypothetical protein